MLIRPASIVLAFFTLLMGCEVAENDKKNFNYELIQSFDAETYSSCQERASRPGRDYNPSGDLELFQLSSFAKKRSCICYAENFGPNSSDDLNQNSLCHHSNIRKRSLKNPSLEPESCYQPSGGEIFQIMRFTALKLVLNKMAMYPHPKKGALSYKDLPSVCKANPSTKAQKAFKFYVDKAFEKKTRKVNYKKRAKRIKGVIKSTLSFFKLVKTFSELRERALPRSHQVVSKGPGNFSCTLPSYQMMDSSIPGSIKEKVYWSKIKKSDWKSISKLARDLSNFKKKHKENSSLDLVTLDGLIDEALFLDSKFEQAIIHPEDWSKSHCLVKRSSAKSFENSQISKTSLGLELHKRSTDLLLGSGLEDFLVNYYLAEIKNVLRSYPEISFEINSPYFHLTRVNKKQSQFDVLSKLSRGGFLSIQEDGAYELLQKKSKKSPWILFNEYQGFLKKSAALICDPTEVRDEDFLSVPGFFKIALKSYENKFLMGIGNYNKGVYEKSYACAKGYMEYVDHKVTIRRASMGVACVAGGIGVVIDPTKVTGLFLAACSAFGLLESGYELIDSLKTDARGMAIMNQSLAEKWKPKGRPSPAVTSLIFGAELLGISSVSVLKDFRKALKLKKLMNSNADELSKAFGLRRVINTEDELAAAFKNGEFDRLAFHMKDLEKRLLGEGPLDSTSGLVRGENLLQNEAAKEWGNIFIQLTLKNSGSVSGKAGLIKAITEAEDALLSAKSLSPTELSKLRSWLLTRFASRDKGSLVWRAEFDELFVSSFLKGSPKEDVVKLALLTEKSFKQAPGEAVKALRSIERMLKDAKHLTPKEKGIIRSEIMKLLTGSSRVNQSGTALGLLRESDDKLIMHLWNRVNDSMNAKAFENSKEIIIGLEKSLGRISGADKKSLSKLRGPIIKVLSDAPDMKTAKRISQVLDKIDDKVLLKWGDDLIASCASKSSRGASGFKLSELNDELLELQKTLDSFKAFPRKMKKVEQSFLNGLKNCK